MNRKETIFQIFMYIGMIVLGCFCGSIYEQNTLGNQLIDVKYDNDSLNLHIEYINNEAESSVKDKGNKAFTKTDNPQVVTANKQNATRGRKVGSMVGYENPNPK